MKKNRRSMPCCNTASVIRCLLLIKSTMLLVCFFSLQSIANSGFAQEHITLKLENATLKKAFTIIEKQTSYRFIYNDADITDRRKISISIDAKPVGAVMEKLLAHTSLSFKILSGNLIVVTEQAKDAVEDLAFFQMVSGKVTDGNNEPLVNVTIQEKGTNNGTLTKEDGSFSLNVLNASAVLVIRYIGFVTQEVPVAGRSSITIQLKEDTRELSQVVVVGYGTQKRSDITGSITSVPKARLSQLPVTNVLQAIQGSVAGVNITQTSSVPGSSPSALVRGVNSINANTGPFIVVDGIPFSTTGGTLNDINSNDIASIEILKDASAVAIYGTRGSNGVILITTKRGSTGKPVIRYSGYAGFEELGHILEPGSPEQYVQKYADYLQQINQPQTSVLPNAYEVENYNAGKTTDWIKEATRQGVIHDHNLSISGGTDHVKYFVSGEYLKQKGVVKGYQYQRVSFRSNLDVNITDYLTAGTSLFYTNNNYDGGRANFYLAAAMSPYGKVYNDITGEYEIYPMYPELLYANPLLGLNTDRLNRSNNLNGNFYAEIRPAFLKGLKYRINTGYSYVPTRENTYTGRNANNTLGQATAYNSEIKNWVIENILTYVKDWDKHHIDFTGLYSAQRTDNFYSSINATGFINDGLSFNNLGAGATISATTIRIDNTDYTSGTYRTQTSLLSQMGRINYNYDSRYLFTFTARRDGYSAFGSNTNKYGIFPSAAFGWNISNEHFMKGVEFVNNLKLRLSYGKSGNQAIGPNQTTTTAASVRIPYSGLSTVGVLANVLGNPDLTWETTKGLNVGLDFSVLANRINGTVEFYRTNTEDILLRRNLPNITGYSSIWDNLGKLSNKGIEITLNTTNVKTRDFSWEMTTNFSANSNKIVELYGDGRDDVGNRWFIGKPLRAIYDYRMEGIWQVGEDPSSQDPGAKPGDLKFADVNGDKQITADDRQYLGTTLPKWIGGLTNTFHYRNWHLNIFVQTFQGALKDNVNLTFADEAGRMNTPVDIGYWTEENKSNTRPALSYTNTRGYRYPSGNSYTRIKDVTLSYTTPQAFLDRMGLGALTVYLSGRNLHTFTSWKGWDPENDFTFRGSTGWDNNYPLIRSYVLGVNVTLK